MSAWSIAVALSVAAAILHAAAAVFQERLAGRSANVVAGRFGIVRMIGLPRWWWAVGLTGAAASLHVAALHFGPLTLVQPLGALTLVVAVASSAGLARRRVTRGEWLGVGMTVAGLGVLLTLTAGDKPRVALTAAQVLSVTLIVLLLLAALVVGAGRIRHLVGRSLFHATAAGLSFGVASAVAQTVMVRMADGGWREVITPASVVVLALAFAGLLLAQSAYRAGVGAPLAMLTIVNPVGAAVIGVHLLGERLAAGAAGAAVAGAAATVAACGVVLLSRHRHTQAATTPAPEPVLAAP